MVNHLRRHRNGLKHIFCDRDVSYLFDPRNSISHIVYLWWYNNFIEIYEINHSNNFVKSCITFTTPCGKSRICLVEVSNTLCVWQETSTKMIFRRPTYIIVCVMGDINTLCTLFFLNMIYDFLLLGFFIRFFSYFIKGHCPFFSNNTIYSLFIFSFF